MSQAENGTPHLPDKNADRNYFLFFGLFFTTSVLPALPWGLGISVLLLVGLLGNLPGEPAGNTDLLGFVLIPLNLIFVIAIISAICLFRPLKKPAPPRDGRSSFHFYRFFSVILVWLIIFSLFSVIFGIVSTNPDPKRASCEVCGNTNQFMLYEFTVNDVAVHRYCAMHAVHWAFLHPVVVLLDPPTHGAGFTTKFSQNDMFILLSALLSIYTWVFVIGFALVLGDGYTWGKGL
jgi:hypothetical protein